MWFFFFALLGLRLLGADAGAVGGGADGTAGVGGDGGGVVRDFRTSVQTV